MKYDPIIFAMPESVDPEQFIVATYYVETDSEDLLAVCSALAVEQTTGTWVPVPGETAEVRQRHVGRVISVQELPDYEFDMGERKGRRKVVFQVAFPWANIGQQIPELLSTVIGNISMGGFLKLIELHFPQSWVEGFPGPKFGLTGLREMFDVQEGPLVLGMIKPCTGLTVEQTADLFYELAAAGVHMVKDDELIADPCHAYLEDRVQACQAAAERAFRETGNRAIYLANITDRPDRMLDKAYRLLDAGATGLMVNALATGYGALEMITADPKINVPVLAHPCFAGAYYESPFSGVSSHLVLGKLLRLAGADMVVYMTPYGKLEATREKYIRTAIALRAPFYHLKPTAPLPAAGMNPGMVWRTYADLGEDWVIAAGGAMHGHPGGVKAGVMAFKQAAQAARLGIGPAEAAAQHTELADALEAWPAEADAGQLYELQR